MIRLAEAVGALETPACRSNTTPAEACSLLAGRGGAQGGARVARQTLQSANCHRWRARWVNQKIVYTSRFVRVILVGYPC